jgi:hypothetical protein
MSNRAGSPPDTWERRIVAALTGSEPLTMGQLRQRLGGPTRSGGLSPGLRRLVVGGRVLQHGDVQRRHTYSLSPVWVKPGRKNTRPSAEERRRVVDDLTLLLGVPFRLMQGGAVRLPATSARQLLERLRAPEAQAIDGQGLGWELRRLALLATVVES